MRKILILAALLVLELSQAASARPILLKGKVTDSKTGKGIAGVVVSDGMHCTATDKKGAYSIESATETVYNVFVVTPSAYEVPMSEISSFSGYAPVDTLGKSFRHDFVLTPREQDCDHYIMVYSADPQAMSSRPHSVAGCDYYFGKLAEYSKTVSLPLYQTVLGDMVTNEIEVPGMAENYLTQFAKCGVRSFSIPGNHDHVQAAPNYHESVAGFARWFGPYNYAANIGKVHYLFLDDCAWRDPSAKKHKFAQGFNEEAMTFIEEDLKYVPVGTPLVISAHCPVTRAHNGTVLSTFVNKDRFWKALEGREVYLWYGHTHLYTNYSYTQKELDKYAPGVKSLDSHVAGRCDGAWCCSGEITMDAVPRGIVECEVDGTSIKWRFRSVDENYPDNFNVYLPGQFAGDDNQFHNDEMLYCNVYLWDNAWELPELWADGKFVSKIPRIVTSDGDATCDPLYARFFPVWKSMNIVGFRDLEFPKDMYCTHLFGIVPPAGLKNCEIRIKDRWGHTYVRKVE